jgi:hypothetical protein
MRIKVVQWFAWGMLCLAPPLVSAAPDYLSVKEIEVERQAEKSGKNLLDLEIEVNGAVPVDGKSGAFGYAALSDQGNNVLVVATHLPIDDSSHEDPKTGFHTHVLDLKAPTPACAGATFEVDLENSKKNAAFDADYKWRVEGSKIKVEKVPAADLGDPGIEGFASFTLKPVMGADGKPTNLCVTVVDQI